MAVVPVGFLLQNLKQLLLYNAELLGDAKNQVEALHDDLTLFKALIKDSTEQQTTNHTVLALLDHIRKVVYRAEDVVDRFVVEKAKYGEKHFIRKSYNLIGHSFTIRGVAKHIESIRKEIAQIYKEKQFGFQALTRTDQFPDKSKQSTEDGDEVFGFDVEAQTVVERLVRVNLDLDIITITGSPGHGKTTLARKVYNDLAATDKFSRQVWVYVSKIYSIKEIFLEMLSNFDQTTSSKRKSIGQLAEDLRRHLELEKYLIVVDDVWAEQAWDDLKRAFPNNRNGSRILITSRNNKVATHANPANGIHGLKFLTTNESWEMLKKRVFGTRNCSSSELSLGLQIAAKCKGLPLAIRAIASRLLNNPTSNDWWKQVAENASLFVIQDPGFLDGLALSYHHLEHHLKSCFLYLGVFPENYEIPVWNLIHLWIAEGFIEENGDLNLEEVAEACVDDLVNKNLLMVVQRRSNGRIKTCRVHAMFIDFCKKEAGEQKLYQEVKPDHATQVPSENNRRVCIHFDVMKYLSLKPRGEHVRSFLSFSPNEIAMHQDLISKIPKAFELLRVLDIRAICFDIFPKDILHLALLRYIAIRCNINVIPATFSKLWNMQTIIFITSSRTLNLKYDFWKMDHLRHLRTNSSALLPAPSTSSPTGRKTVQSLSTIAPESCTEQVLERTPNIKKLGIRGKLAILLDSGSDLFDNIGKLQYMTNLKLYNDVYHHSLSHQGKIISLPPAYKFPTKLKKLTLSETKLEWKYMQIIGNLENLEVLKLKDNAFEGTVWLPEGVGFQSLKVLFVHKNDLMYWEASCHHFPSLQRLVLRHCERLEAVPMELADIGSFQALEIYHTPKAARSARAIQERKLLNGASSNEGFKLSVYPQDI